MRRSRHALFAALLYIAVSVAALPRGARGAQGAAAPAAGVRVPAQLDDGDRVVLRGNVPPRARPELEIGRTDANLPMRRMILQLEPRPGAKAQIQQLLLDQQDAASPLYHRWLTPEEFGARFGLAGADLQLVTGWLQAHGFTVEEVAKGRGWINFSGVASQVEEAFATEMHDYRVDGTIRHANSIDPSIPRGLAGLVGGVVSLHSFPRPARHHGIHPASGLRPRFNEAGGLHDLAPADFATIYDLDAAYRSGNDGSGQSIAIVARTDILLSDVRRFRSTFGLPAKDPVFVHNGPDPGIVSGDEGESDLDTQWAGAVAPGATIKLVISATTTTTDGVLLSAQYIVDQNLAPVATTSYGLCESQQGASEIAFYDNLLSQGAAQGITSFAVAGDAGAADCSDPNSSSTGSGRAVDNPCSSPNNTCVGGTQFNDIANPNAYWAASNDPITMGSALSYIPEVAWNESGNATGGSGLWSTGGGASSFFSKPSWQVAPGVPADGRRDVPDVSLSAAAHDGYLAFMGGALYSFYGTSAAAPSFAGLMALVVQRTGSRQGNANPAFYKLAATQYGGSGPAVFHDITTGSNSVPGVTGYSCGTGYDQVTGLGSVDGAVLLETWPGSIPPDTSPCAAGATTLCLNNNRFEVKATFDAGGGNSGPAQTVALSDDTGYLWFFAASNVEAVVKVLNGCGLGGHYWVFAGGLTNVNVVMKVRDSQTGAVQTYVNPAKTTFLPIQDTAAFSTCP